MHHKKGGGTVLLRRQKFTNVLFGLSIKGAYSFKVFCSIVSIKIAYLTLCHKRFDLSAISQTEEIACMHHKKGDGMVFLRRL